MESEALVVVKRTEGTTRLGPENALQLISGCVFARTLMEQWHLMKEDEHQIYCLLGRLDDMGRAIIWDLTTSAFNWSCSW